MRKRNPRHPFAGGLITGLICLLGAMTAAGSRQALGGSPGDPVPLILPQLAADGGFQPEERMLGMAELQWEAAGFDDYDLTVQVSRFGPSETHVVTVRGGTPVAIRSHCSAGGEEVPCVAVEPASYAVDGLFGLIRDRIARIPTEPESPEDPPGRPFVTVAYGRPHGLPYAIDFGLRGVPDAFQRIEVSAFSLADPKANLQAARQRWEAHAWYEYFTEAAFWSPATGFGVTTGVLVRDGQVISFASQCVAAPNPQPWPCETLDPAAVTVPGMFAFVSGLLDEVDDGFAVAASYHVVDGHLLRASWGPPGDDDLRATLTVSRFDPLH